MRYDSGQFGSFDGKDNRRTVIELFQRMGKSLSPQRAANLRGGFLAGMLSLSTNGFAKRQVVVTPCSPVEAYFLFVHIAGVLGVAVEEAAKKLELAIYQMEQVTGPKKMVELSR